MTIYSAHHVLKCTWKSIRNLYLCAIFHTLLIFHSLQYLFKSMNNQIQNNTELNFTRLATGNINEDQIQVNV